MIQFNFSSRKQLIFLCCFFFLVIFSACKKDLDNLRTITNRPVLVDTSQYVLGAHGELILKSNFHIIEKGYKLTIQNQHVYKVEIASGKFVEDFGDYKPINSTSQNNTTSTLKSTPSTAVDFTNSSEDPSSKTINSVYGPSSGWVAAEEWHNIAANPINYFSTGCLVPILPTTQNNQTFSFWIGLSPSSGGNGSIVQPILNYGQTPQSNVTNSYQVFNYFFWVSGVNNNAAMTTPELVASGSNVKFIISYSGITGGSYDYVSNILNASGLPITPTMNITVGNQYLNGLSSGNIDIPAVSESNYADIVLEDRPVSPYITSRSEYPNTLPYTSYVAMTSITLSTGNPGQYNYPATIPWYPITTGAPGGPQLGENAQIVSNNNNNPTIPGQINLWYACATPTSQITNPSWINSTKTLSWGAVSGATQYDVIINNGPNGGGAYYFTSSTSIPNFFSTLEQSNTPGTYQVIIIPRNSCNNGPSTYYSFTYTN
jgi:hypothetical protein